MTVASEMLSVHAGAKLLLDHDVASPNLGGGCAFAFDLEHGRHLEAAGKLITA
jgi:hypothetical protein